MEPGFSLMTPIGVVEGDVLTYLDEHGATTLRRLVDELDCSVSLIAMGVGALIREGLVRGSQRNLDILIEPRTSSESSVQSADQSSVPLYV